MFNNNNNSGMSSNNNNNNKKNAQQIYKNIDDSLMLVEINVPTQRIDGLAVGQTDRQTIRIIITIIIILK